MGIEIKELEPKNVWSYFYDFTQHPRPSKKEEKIIAYLENTFKELGFEYKKDEIGNLAVKKPATPGMENRKSFCIQAHIDMVCEKYKELDFDFDNDPIETEIVDGWVKAKGTTLGSDNGMGAAMGLAILASTDIPHPAYELLLTVDEETGMTGVLELKEDFIDSDVLINLDTEDDHVFSIGCAGGISTVGKYKYEADVVPSGYLFYNVGIQGLLGGHSGVQINEERANAAKLLTRFLLKASEDFGIRLSSFDSGSKHNAIPRDANAVVAISSENESGFLEYLNEFDSIIKSEYQMNEPDVNAYASKTEAVERVLSKESQRLILLSFTAIHHGIGRWSTAIEGLVQTSTNFAIIETKADYIEVLTSQRSSIHTEKMQMASTVGAAMELGGAEVSYGDGYPSWEPNMDSPIVKTASAMHEELFGSKPVLEVIHAGLECGLIGAKYPKMDMLSFGPTIKEAHTPEEKIEIITVQNSWDLLLKILANMPEKS